MIIEKGNKFELRSKDGSKSLGTYSTMAEARAREKQVLRFKKRKK